MVKPANYYEKAAELWFNQAEDNLKWRPACEKLTVYYAPTRYPEVLALPEYTQEIAQEALDLAEKILEFAKKR